MRSVGTDGLYRTALGGPGASMFDAFRHLRQREMTPWRETIAAQVPIRGGHGVWELISVGNDIFVVTSRCHYEHPRSEMVTMDGMLQFHISLEGPALVTTEDGLRIPVGAAQLVACRGSAQNWYTVACLPGTRTSVSVYVRRGYFQENFGWRPSRNDQDPFLGEDSSALIVRSSPLPVAILSLARELVLNNHSGTRRLVYCHSKIHELLCLLAQESERQSTDEQTVPLTEVETQRLWRAREILAARLKCPPTLTQLASQLGTNTSKLKRGFKQLFGQTAFEFSLECRMNEALKLLSERKMPVGAVARLVGYDCQSSFSDAFQGHFGVLPKVVRKAGCDMVRTRGRPAGSDAIGHGVCLTQSEIDRSIDAPVDCQSRAGRAPVRRCG